MSKAFPTRFVTTYGDGGWRYRRLTPEDCHAVLGRKNWTRAWPAGTDEETVIREAKKLAAQHDAEIARARGDVDAAAEATARALHRGAKTPDDIAWGIQFFTDAGQHRLAEALAGGGTLPKKTMTVSKALEHDRKTHSADIDPRPGWYAVKSFVEVCGDLDVLAISRGDVSTWLAAQREEGLAASTIRRRYGSLKAMVDRTMRDLGSEKRSPFEHRVGGKSRATDKLPLNTAMLDLLNAYLDSGRAGHETINILRIMQGTGCGPAEVGGLLVSDVSLDSPVPYAHVRENGLRSLKKEVRARRVPLVGMALKAAQDAVNRAEGRDNLFNSYSTTRGADSLSAKLNKAIRTAGIPHSPRLSSYSLRHTVAQALRTSGAHYSLQRDLLGHAHADSSDLYGSPTAEMREKQKALRKALKVLGEVDDTQYGPDERMSGDSQ